MTGNKYIDYCTIKGKRERVVLFVSSLAHVGQPPYGTVYQKPNGALRRVIRGDRLPTYQTFDAAQKGLDVYAISNRLKRVTYCEVCGSEIVTDVLDCSTNQRFCSTKCADREIEVWEALGEDTDDDTDQRDCGCSEDEHCPLCCTSIFSPGSEECDFCPHYEECGELQP